MFFFLSRGLLDLMFSLTYLPVSSITSSMPESLFSSFCILLVKLSSLDPVWILKFLISRTYPQLVFSLLILFLVSGLEQFYSFPCSVCLVCVCVFLDFFKEIIYILQISVWVFFSVFI